jgi:GNAT superfamily N-acetyltransferase
MLLRDALIEDFKEIHTLSSQLGYAYPSNLLKNKLKKILTYKDHKIIVAEADNNKVVGYVHGQIYELLYFDRVVNILGIVIDKKYRGKGYGKRLMEKIEEWAKENNCNGIRLTSNVKRKEAHLFYENMGYKSEKESKYFIKLF